MMKTVLALSVFLTLFMVTTTARAEHTTAMPPAEDAVSDGTKTESALDLSLKLGINGFRLGSRVFGRDGYAGGAWINGETRGDGFSLDGRVERGGKAHNFKFNADIDEWVRRAVRWWSVTDL